MERFFLFFFPHFPLYLLSFLFSVSPLFRLKRVSRVRDNVSIAVKCSPLDDFSFFFSFFLSLFFFHVYSSRVFAVDVRSTDVSRLKEELSYTSIFSYLLYKYRSTENVNVLGLLFCLFIFFVTLSFVHGLSVIEGNKSQNGRTNKDKGEKKKRKKREKRFKTPPFDLIERV